MSARSALLAVTMSIAIAAAGLGAVASSPVAAAAPSWETTFRDDFNGSGLPNPADWQLVLGTSYPGGPANFGTGEIQTMTDNPNNVDVRNGNLYITPQRDTVGAWTSARVESVRANFKPPTDGVMHVESRLQMPNVTGVDARGYWPAFWMLGGPSRADRWSWPSIGEVDIMENVQGLNWTFNVLHCGEWGKAPCNEPEGISNGDSNNNGTPCRGTTCQAGFHTYGFEWDTSGAVDQMRWYLDGEQTFSVDETDVTPKIWTEISQHAGYFMILNVAMGGAFPNKLNPGAAGPLSSTKPGVPMVVDYVEVKYAGGQSVPSATPSTPPTATPPATTPPVPTDPPSSTTPPTGGPANLRVTGTTGSSITVGWDGPATASYDILRAGERIASVTGQTFTDIGLLPNTPYLYSVRAGGITTPVLTATLASLPETTTTPTATNTPAPTTTPQTGPPGNLRVVSTTPSTVTIAWDGPVCAEYQILRSGIQIATSTSPTFTDAGLVRATPYLYSVRAGGVATPVLTAVIP
jgi:beta-glucanase (GH16 family)